jgi:hypothetical protein
MIDVIDTLTGTPCPLCGDPIGSGFAVTEVQPDEWLTICIDCDLALELDTGK